MFENLWSNLFTSKSADNVSGSSSPQKSSLSTSKSDPRLPQMSVKWRDNILHYYKRINTPNNQNLQNDIVQLRNNLSHFCQFLSTITFTENNPVKIKNILSYEIPRAANQYSSGTLEDDKLSIYDVEQSLLLKEKELGISQNPEPPTDTAIVFWLQENRNLGYWIAFDIKEKKLNIQTKVGDTWAEIDEEEYASYINSDKLYKLSSHSYEAFQLATYETDNNQVHLMQAFHFGKNINKHWYFQEWDFANKKNCPLDPDFFEITKIDEKKLILYKKALVGGRIKKYEFSLEKGKKPLKDEVQWTLYCSISSDEEKENKRNKDNAENKSEPQSFYIDVPFSKLNAASNLRILRSGFSKSKNGIENLFVTCLEDPEQPGEYYLAIETPCEITEKLKARKSTPTIASQRLPKKGKSKSSPILPSSPFLNKKNLKSNNKKHTDNALIISTSFEDDYDANNINKDYQPWSDKKPESCLNKVEDTRDIFAIAQELSDKKRKEKFPRQSTRTLFEELVPVDENAPWGDFIIPESTKHQNDSEIQPSNNSSFMETLRSSPQNMPLQHSDNPLNNQDVTRNVVTDLLPPIELTNHAPEQEKLLIDINDNDSPLSDENSDNSFMRRNTDIQPDPEEKLICVNSPKEKVNELHQNLETANLMETMRGVSSNINNNENLERNALDNLFPPSNAPAKLSNDIFAELEFAMDSLPNLTELDKTRSPQNLEDNSPTDLNKKNLALKKPLVDNLFTAINQANNQLEKLFSLANLSVNNTGKKTYLLHQEGFEILHEAASDIVALTTKYLSWNKQLDEINNLINDKTLNITNIKETEKTIENTNAKFKKLEENLQLYNKVKQRDSTIQLAYYDAFPARTSDTPSYSSDNVKPESHMSTSLAPIEKDLEFNEDDDSLFVRRKHLEETVSYKQNDKEFDSSIYRLIVDSLTQHRKNKGQHAPVCLSGDEKLVAVTAVAAEIMSFDKIMIAKNLTINTEKARKEHSEKIKYFLDKRGFFAKRTEYEKIRQSMREAESMRDNIQLNAQPVVTH